MSTAIREAVTKGGCEGQEVKQSEANGSTTPQPGLDEYAIHHALETC